MSWRAVHSRHVLFRSVTLVVASCASEAPAAQRSSQVLQVGPDVHVSRERGGTVHAEPVIAAHPDDLDHLVAAAMQVLDPLGTGWHESQTVQTYRSTDGGRSWAAVDLPGLPEGLTGDPWLVWPARGRLYLSLLAVDPAPGDPNRVRTWIYRSRDRGASWEGPLRDVFPPEISQDHPVIVPWRGDDATDGLYALASLSERGRDGIALSRMDVDGTWRPLPEYVPGPEIYNLGGAVALGRDTAVFTHFTSQAPPRRLWAARTLDGGRSYERVLLDDDFLPMGFPTMAVGRSAGFGRRVYSAWIDARNGAALDVLVSYSDDAGASWSDAVRVHEETGGVQRSLPSVTTNHLGTVAVSWMDQRFDTRGSCWDAFIAASPDGGRTFGTEVRVSDTTACVDSRRNGAAANRWGRVGGGDYHGMTAAADGAFHVIWVDNRSGIFQVYTATARFP